MESSMLFTVIGLHIWAFGLTILVGLLYLYSTTAVYAYNLVAIIAFVAGGAAIVTVLGGRMTWKYARQAM
jgi:hypothetical protein